jgi:RND family efflux transporter MFP subunit
MFPWRSDRNSANPGGKVSVWANMGRPRPLFVGAVMAAALAACGQAPEPPAPEIRPVRVVSVEKSGRGDVVSLTGTVQAQTDVNLAFRIDGRMVERLVNVGDAVKAGQVVARLNPDTERSALQGARADLVAAQGQLVEARNNFNRQKRLLEQGFISKAAFDAVAQTLQTAQSRVTSAQSQVDIASNRLGYTELIADAPGVVTKVGAEPGEVVAAGRMVVEMARDDGRDAVFDVPPRLKDAAPANPEITVSLTTDPGVSAPGRVREVSPRADPVTGTFKVRVGLIDPPAGLRLGSTVTGRMRIEGIAGMTIPASALIQSQGQAAVWVVDPATQTVSLRNVGVATFDPANVVVSDGLLPGDIVVTAGVHALRPGQKVRLLGAPK